VEEEDIKEKYEPDASERSSASFSASNPSQFLQEKERQNIKLHIPWKQKEKCAI